MCGGRRYGVIDGKISTNGRRNVSDVSSTCHVKPCGVELVQRKACSARCKRIMAMLELTHNSAFGSHSRFQDLVGIFVPNVRRPWRRDYVLTFLVG